MARTADPTSARQRQIRYGEILGVSHGTIETWERNGVFTFPSVNVVSPREIAVLIVAAMAAAVGVLILGPPLLEQLR